MPTFVLYECDATGRYWSGSGFFEDARAAATAGRRREADGVLVLPAGATPENLAAAPAEAVPVALWSRPACRPPRTSAVNSTPWNRVGTAVYESRAAAFLAVGGRAYDGAEFVACPVGFVPEAGWDAEYRRPRRL